MTTEELFEEMEKNIELYEPSDEYIELESQISRVMMIPQRYTVIGVESDEKAERFKFRFPKIVGNNIDLSTLSIRINYRNANKEIDQNFVENLRTDGEYTAFEWVPTRKVTKYKGTVDFIVCAVKTNSDGTITNEWNTTIAQVETLEGIEVEVTEEEEEKARDILLQLLIEIEKKGEEIKESLAMPSDEQVNNAVNKYFQENPPVHAGNGMPSGGTAGQLLAKKSDTDYDVEWIDGYVTPEMFGAKGDGVTDDSDSFEKMISERKPIFLSKKYHLSKSLTFYSDLFSSTNGEVIFDTAVAMEGNGIHATGVIFNGNNLSPYIQLRGDDIVIHKCKFKDFSGNEAYKRTEGLYIGEDGDVLHTGIVVDSCLFDGATCKYENGVVGDNQGSLRQIYVRNSSVKILNCEFKNLSGMEDGDIIHLQSRSISNTNYPYNKQGNLIFPSVPCIIQGNIFHLGKGKSAVKVQCSDVIVKNNIAIVEDVADTENKPRYVFRSQCSADVNISDNIVILEKTDALKLTYVFGVESMENVNVSNNIVYDYSTGIDATYDELRSSHIIHAMYCRNLTFLGNNMLLTGIHNLIDIEYCSMTFSKNRVELLGEYPETIFYMNREYTHSASTSDVSENTILGFEENEIFISGTRSKICIETMYIGSIRFRKNKIYGNVSSFEFNFGAYCPISFCEIEDIPDIPLSFKTITGKDFSKIAKVTLENCKLVYADVQMVDFLLIKDCDISSTYQAINLTGVGKVEADGNYIHDINNRVFRILSGNPVITLKSNEFDDNNFKVAIESHYNNDGFLRSNVIWCKNNRGTIKEVNTGTEPDSTMSYELGFIFFKESENKFVMNNGKGSWI